MVRFTCQKHPECGQAGQDGKATDNWGATAFGAVKPVAGQHWWPWANGFITMSRDAANPRKSKGYQRDEWPPHYFWPGDAAAAARNMVQRVRMIPSEENGCGGRIWKGFCGEYAASANKGKKQIVRSEFIEVKSKDLKPRQEVNGQATTLHSTVSIDTARAVFTFKDFDVPNDPDDGLRLNTKCWPED